MADDTRDLVIALRQDVLHLAEKHAEHVIKSSDDRVKIQSKLDCLEKKIGAFSDLKQQAIGASKAVKAGYVAASAIGVAGMVKMMQIGGLLK